MITYDYSSLYLEINIIGIILTAIILIKLMSSKDLQVSSIAYIKVSIAILFILVLDGAWIIFDNRTSPAARFMNNVINVLYMFQTGLISYLWLDFVLYKLNKDFSRIKLRLILLSLPLVVLFIVSITSPWTHWLFEIDALNRYHRGKYLFIQQVICYGYTLGASIYAFINAQKQKNTEQRNKAFTISTFIILPMIGSIINIISDGLPTIWPMTAISVMMVYMSLQSQQISTDGLTGLNNRRQFDRYINAQLADSHREGELYLLLLDIDDFKRINDTMGHLTGDDALVSASLVFKQVCGMYNAFLSRYGGDEFAIVFQSRDRDRAERLIHEINKKFDEFNTTVNKPYRLTVSVGVGSTTGNSGTVEEIIKQADDALYDMKALKKHTPASKI